MAVKIWIIVRNMVLKIYVYICIHDIKEMKIRIYTKEKDIHDWRRVCSFAKVARKGDRPPWAWNCNPITVDSVSQFYGSIDWISWCWLTLLVIILQVIISYFYLQLAIYFYVTVYQCFTYYTDLRILDMYY